MCGYQWDSTPGRPPTLAPMMFGWRSVVMGLLWLALPLQGYAAATMRHCAPNHHAAAHASPNALSGVADAPSSHAHASPDEAAMAQPVMAQPVMAQPVVAQPEMPHGEGALHDHARASPGDDHPPSFDAAAKAKCSACASCCFGVALPASSVFLPACAPESALPTLLRQERIGFVTDGPDRPPRPPSA